MSTDPNYTLIGSIMLGIFGALFAIFAFYGFFCLNCVIGILIGFALYIVGLTKSQIKDPK